MLKKIILALFFLLFAYRAEATTRCVSSGVGAGAVTAGSDSNSGVGDGSSPASTCKQSTTAAILSMASGDILIFRQGEYDTVNGLLDSNTNTIIKSGIDAGHPTTFQRYQSETVTWRRFMPANSSRTEQQLQTGQAQGGFAARLPNFAECQAAATAAGVSLNFPQSCWTATGAHPPEQVSPIIDPATLSGYVLNLDCNNCEDVNNPIQFLLFDGTDFDAKGITSGNVTLGKGVQHIKFQNLEIRNSIFSQVANPGDDPDRGIILDHTWTNVKVHQCGVPFDTNTVNGHLAREDPVARFWQSFYYHMGGVTWDNVEVYKCASAALSPLGQQNTVKNSYFHDNNAQSIIVYCYPFAGCNWQIFNNVFVTTDTAIQIEATTDVKVYNNTFVSTNNWTNGFLVQDNTAGPMLFENNIIVGYQFGIRSTQQTSFGTTSPVARNNLIQATNSAFDDSSATVSITKTNNVTGQDPLFVNSSLSNYQLQSGSPARHAGIANALTTDKIGNPMESPPDIGAYQFCTGGGCAVAGTTATLHVFAVNPTAAAITVTPLDNNSQGNGTTSFDRLYNLGTTITLTAPSSAGGNAFSGWSGCNSQSSTVCTVTIQATTSVTANFGAAPPPAVLTVTSQNPNSGVDITVSPPDSNAQGNGTTQFQRTYPQGTMVVLTAPATSSMGTFNSWTGCTSVSGTGNRTCNITLNQDSTISANYNVGTIVGCGLSGKNFSLGVSVDECNAGPINLRDAPNGNVLGQLAQGTTGIKVVSGSTTAGGSIWYLYNTTSTSSCTPNGTTCGYATDRFVVLSSGPPTPHTLTVNAFGNTSPITATIAPNDNNSNGSGTIPLTRTYNSGVAITLTVPTSGGTGIFFTGWSGCDSASGLTCNIALNGDSTVVANYSVAQCNVDKVIPVGTRISLCGFTNQTDGSPNYNYVGCQLSGATGTVTGGPVTKPDGTVIIQVTYDQNNQQTNSGGFDCTGAVGGPTNIGWSSRKNPIPADISTSTATLTVNSTNPTSGVNITVDILDNNNNGSGTTAFTRVYNIPFSQTNQFASPNLLAPATLTGKTFGGWSGCAQTSTTNVAGDTCHALVDQNKTVTATYTTNAAPATLTQSNYRFYALRTASNALVPLAGLNVSGISVVKGGKFIVVNQVDSSGDPPSTVTIPYYSRNGGAYAAIPSSFATDHIRLSSVVDVDVPANGATIAACLAGGLTLLAGKIDNSAVSFDLPNNGCTTVGRKIEIESTATAGDTYTFREYLQNGTPLDAYTVSGGIAIIGNQASGGF